MLFQAEQPFSEFLRDRKAFFEMFEGVEGGSAGQSPRSPGFRLKAPKPSLLKRIDYELSLGDRRGSAKERQGGSGANSL